jgi:cytochrome c
MNKRNVMRCSISRIDLKYTGLKYIGVAILGLMAGPGALRAAPADPVAGASVFKKCMACHSTDPSGRSGLGPNLRGVVGRPAARAPGFSYSPAMTASKLAWNEKNLTKFLAAPRQMVPGTRMTFAGLPNSQDRANVIAFLKQSAA